MLRHARGLCGIAGVLAAGVAVTAAAAATVPAPAAAFAWDLDRQYPDAASWLSAQSELRARLSAFTRLQNDPIASARDAADRLDEVRWLRTHAGLMARFAVLHNQVDSTDAVAKQRMDAAVLLESDVERGTAWLDTRLLANGTDVLRHWATQEPRLGAHRWHLERLLALADHVPPAGSEAAVAAVERAAQAPTQIYDALMQVDLGWPKIERADGGPVQVDAQTWPGLARAPDAATRKAANRAFLGRVKSLEEPLGLLLTRRLGANLDLARVRHYPDAIDAFFDWNDGVPAGSYRQIGAVARANRALLARYASVVARLNGRATLDFGDLDAPSPATAQRRFTVAETVDHIAASWSALGADYQATLRTRLARPWMDLAPRPHKGGVGVYWSAGGGDPYTVLTFDGELPGAKVLAEAAATIMFYADVPAAKAPELRESDWPIYGNALWFLGQMRFDDELLRRAAPADRVAILYDNCHRLWARFFQYAIFLDLEREIYASIDRGEPPSGAQITDRYLALLREYLPPTGVLPRIADDFGAIALLESNAYYGEALPEWAFAMASAAAMSDLVDAGNAATLEAIRHPMGKPDSFTSYDLLRDAGVDLATAQPYELLARRFARLLDALERELQPAVDLRQR